MALTRLFIRSALQAGLELTLDSEQAHYLGRTLRLRAGESLAVFNAEFGEFAVVQKATELGVKRITPVLTEYGVVKLSGSRAEKRRDHWQKVAQSACEQSGRTRPPLIEVPVPLKTWFGATTSEADVDLILKPGAGTPMASLTAPSKKVCLLIGPEGGFSDVEYDDAEVSGFVAVSLGPRVLRTETAALAAVTVAETLWGDLGLATS